MGRPSKLTPRVAARIVAAVAAGNTLAASASAGPVGESTMREWRRRGVLEPEGPFGRFARDVEAAELDAERALVAEWRAACPTDWRAAAELLARRFPERWARRATAAVEMSGPGGGPIELTVEERADALADKARVFLANARGITVEELERDLCGDGGDDDDPEAAPARSPHDRSMRADDEADLRRLTG